MPLPLRVELPRLRLYRLEGDQRDLQLRWSHGLEKGIGNRAVDAVAAEGLAGFLTLPGATTVEQIEALLPWKIDQVELYCR